MKLFDVYPLFDVNIVKGKGCKVWDEKGQEYLDLYGGHAVISIGHCHPHYVEKMTKQLQELGFYSNSVINKLQQEVAKDVIDSVYNMVTKYAGKGNRWYDNDPVMLKAVELLRVAPPETQRTAALKLLTALEMNSSDELADTTDN